MARSNRWVNVRWASALCCLMLMAGTTAFAGNPRWVMGLPYYTGHGQMAYFHNNHPLYYTDPGDLSASVTHAQADAIVAAAAGTWNVPLASLVLGQGGALNEHVSGANVYMVTSGPVFPADVASSNATAKPIAVIYDSDGSITDLLLGSGASDPSSCRQNGVTSSVDLLTTAGDIQHALLVLNGRCTGPAAEQLLQMQYQLERAFGRILGLGWSQTNDNVFSGNPQPTAQQALYWPIMHPIDIVCGTYTYQCMPLPFQLRTDDISALAMLYPVGASNVPAGKQYTGKQATFLSGALTFPTGQGMQGTNVVVQINLPFYYNEPWQTVSGVSGFFYEQNAGNVVNGGMGLAQTGGDSESSYEGYYEMAYIPITPMSGADWNTFYITTEAINPLYTGQYSVGPYVAQSIAPSGSAAFLTNIERMASSDIENLKAVGGASDCDTRQDGTAASPAEIATGGWWTGRLCAHGHTAWSMFPVKAGRTLTLEVTALDEHGLASTVKAMPVAGLWSASDALGTLPTIAASTSAFNSIVVGMTTLTVPISQAKELRMAIADQRGDGRPDFTYQARVLYADSIAPARLPIAGGTITISGMGFRAGNQVTIGGVNAQVSSWSATQIVAIAPALSAMQISGTAATFDVVVTDLSTNGSTTMTGALVYGGSTADTMRLISAPTGSVPVGTVAPAAFTVQVLAANGVTPVSGEQVTFAASSALFGSCGAASCVVTTDGTGQASTSVMPTVVGSVTLSATAAGGATLSATFQATAVVRAITAMRPLEYVAANTVVSWMPQVSVAQNGVAADGSMVTWSATEASVSAAQSATDASGMAQIATTTMALVTGNQTSVEACAWTTVCATMTTMAVDPSAFRLAVVSGAGQSVALATTFAPVVLRATDALGHPVAGVTVQIHQTIDGWQPACPATGRCPVPPVYGASQAQLVSDENGLVIVQPMQVAGVAEVTNFAAAAGTQGFVSLSLEAGP